MKDKPKLYPNPELFAARMRLLRAYRKLTQEQLGQRIGLDQKTISLLENGLVLPSAPLHETIRTALDWTDAADRAFDILANDTNTAPPEGGQP
ncbi:hypothetical protein ES708_11479 [subsurface metagenome]